MRVQVASASTQLAEPDDSIVVCDDQAAGAEETRLRGKVPKGTRMYGRKQLVDAILRQEQSFGRSKQLAIVR